MPSLSGNTALDVAIGLAFTYLLFSLLCSAIQEWIAGVLDLRAKKLEAGLRSMLADEGQGEDGAPTVPESQPTAPTGPAPASPSSPAALVAAANPGAQPAGLTGGSPGLVDQVLAHDLIRSTYKAALNTRLPILKGLGSVPLLGRPLRARRGPSYLSSRSFAIALLDLLAPSSQTGDPLAGIEAEISAANLPQGTRSTLLTMVKHVAKDRDHLRGVIEQWFDDTMARVSGWYKRQAQIILCVIAALVTIGLNVNTVAIGERLAKDDTVRAAVVDQATKTQDAGGTIDQAEKQLNQAHSLGLPFGWSEEDDNPAKVGGHFWRTAAGWLLSWLALSLGAPFWFDALSKLARLRTSGVPEAPHEQAPRKDSPSSVVTTETVNAAGQLESRTTTTTMPG